MKDVTSTPPTTHPSPIEQLYRREWAGLVRLAWLLTGSKEAGEDIVHDAFVKLDSRPGLEGNLGPYLRRIVINYARDHHRRRSVERRHRPSAPSPTLNPEIDETWRELVSLPDRQRQALVLRYYEDLSVAQVAEVLECPTGTAASLIHRGLARLRKVVTR